MNDPETGPVLLQISRIFQTLNRTWKPSGDPCVIVLVSVSARMCVCVFNHTGNLGMNVTSESILISRLPCKDKIRGVKLWIKLLHYL